MLWMDEAKIYIGQKEIKGLQTNPVIQSWLEKLKAWWRDDETAWCGTFVAHCLQFSGYALPKYWYRALDWLNWGVEIAAPCYGCIVVFNRKGGGHVGFCVGKDKAGRLLILGGNQGDAVSIVPFDADRVAGYRMPVGVLSRPDVPILVTQLTSSTNEA